MQYRIPQDVQIADKIVGPLTLRQLIILMVGGGLDYIIFMSLGQTWEWGVWGPPVFIIGLLTLALAFVEINKVPFLQYILLVIEYRVRPRKRLFNRTDSLLYVNCLTTYPSKYSKKQEKKVKKYDPNVIKDFDNFIDILEKK